MNADLLIYVAVVVALWVVYLLWKHRRRASKPRLGDADAYDGNLMIPAVGNERRGTVSVHSSHGSDHVTHSAAHHAGHFGGHVAGGGHH